MTQGEQDRPEEESGEEQPRAEESQHTNYVPGSAADPTMRQGTPSMGGTAYYGPVTSPEERNWSMLVHLSGLAGIIFPFVTNWLAPLAVWLLFRARSDMVDYHGKRALNFQISWSIYFIIATVSIAVLIGFLLVPILGILWLIWTILAAVRASRGDPPGYILAIPFLR